LLKKIDPEGKYLFSNHTETTQRLYNILNRNEELVREAFSMLYALPAATVMYYGDEIGMENEPLTEGEDDTRFVSRGRFDWDRVQQQKQDPNSLWHHVRQCMNRVKN
jgi:glycosidase